MTVYCRESVGVLRYSMGTQGPRLVLDIDSGIGKLTRALIPKCYYVQPPMYPAHVSVVRHERPKNWSAWGKHHGARVKFWYNPIVCNDDVYWWLNVRCPFLSEVRVELGLPPTRFTPQDAAGGFHTTVGNTKAQA